MYESSVDMVYVGNLRSKITSEVQSAIECVEGSFRENPIDYTIESAITTDVLRHLRKNWGKRIPARAGYLSGPPANYKHPYLNALSKVQSIRNVQPEVNIGISSHFDETIAEEQAVITDINANNARVDIALLKPESHPLFSETNNTPEEGIDLSEDTLEICIAKGSKYYPPQAVTHAIEVKFIKDKTSPGSGLENNPPTWHKIDGDIKKLELLAEFGSGGTGAECHLVLVNNMNIFQVGLDTGHPEYRPKFRRRLENLVQYCEQENNKDPIHVWDIHPPRIEL